MKDTTVTNNTISISSSSSSDLLTYSSDLLPNTVTISDNSPLTSYYTDYTNTYATTAYTVNTSDILAYMKDIKQLKTEEKELSPIDKKIKERIEKNKKLDAICFLDIKEYVPNKVYEFTIRNRKIKTICDESDEFNLEKAFFIAIAKYYYGRTHTPEGVVRKAENCMLEKRYIKIVQGGMKLFNLLKEKEEYDKAEEERKKLRHQKYVQKKIERKAKKQNELYNVIKNAIEDAK